MLDFPNSPQSGDSYEAPTGQIYTFDGVKWLASTQGAAANLGSFKIQNNYLGTQGDNGGWGGSAISIDPGGESYSGLYIPSVAAQNDGQSLEIYNNRNINSTIRLLIRNGSYEFSPSTVTMPLGSSITFPDGSIQTTAFQGGDTDVWVEEFAASNNNNVVPGATSVEYDADGNAIAVFSITNLNNTFSNTLVAKFDTTGTKQWEVIFQGGNYTDGWGLAVDVVNNQGYVAGRATIGGSYDQSLLTKIDLVNGHIVWTKRIDFGAASNSPVVDVGTDGNPVMVGYANNGTDDYITVTKLLASDGSVVWCRTLDGYGEERANGMAIGPNNEVVVIGYENQLSEIDPAVRRVLVAKFDVDGSLQWQKSVEIDSGKECSGADADIDSLGNIYVCGNYYDTNDNNQVMFMFQMDSQGSGQWTRRVKGNCNDSATSIVVGPDDHLYLSAITGNNGTEDFSLVIAKYNRDGTVVWQRLLDNTTSWTFGGNWWFGNGGGSNLAVKTGYVIIAGGFSDPFGTPPHGILAQVNVDGTQFATGNYDFKSVSFSGLLTGSPTIVTDTRTVGSVSPGITNFDPDYDYNQNQLIGSVYVAGGGTVSIGDITFSGNRMIGAGADSGDGSNNDTIQLVPDSTLYNNDQYLVIDPTNPNHIHIRAGGTQDASNALLFLGGEQTNVLVTDSDHSVNISTWDGNNTNFGWKFNNSGGTVFPTLSVERGDNPSGTITGQTLLFGNDSIEAIISTPNGVLGNPYSQRLVINPGKGYDYGEGGDIYLWAGRGGDGSGSGGDIKIRGGQGGSNSLGGNGGAGGYIRMEAGDGAVGDGVAGTAGFIEITGGRGLVTGGDVTITGGRGDTTHGKVRISTIDYNWEFGADGSLTVPGDIKSADGVGPVVIEANDGTLRTWTFGGDGKLLLPGGNAQIVVEDDYGVRIGTGALNTAPSSHIRIGGADHAFEIFGGPPGYSWKFDADGTTAFPENILHTTNNLTLKTSGRPLAVTAITYSSGSWDLNPNTGLTTTTAGSGSGLTVDVTVDVSGYATAVSIVNPGDGYRAGDVITATSGAASVIFTISILPEKNWIFGTDGRTTFPVATVPEHSYGATGDKQGMVAFDSTYIYYCTADFGSTQYPAQTALSEANGVDNGYLVPNSWQLPQVGWIIYYNNQTTTINQVNNGSNPGYYTIFVDTRLSIPANANFYYSPPGSSDIWKRTVQGAGTW